MSVVIAISNQKGGVSKTTTAFNLGACLALNHGKKVLLIDIDPQANLSEYLGYEPDGKPTMTGLIMNTCTNGVIQTNDVLSTVSRETILKRILSDEVTYRYDFVLIDCLPSLSTLLINALAAADRVLIPVQTQKFSMDGLQALESLLEQIKNTINPKVNLLGILPTMSDRTTVSRNAVNALSKKYGEMMFRTAVSKSVEAAKSSETGIPLCACSGRLGKEYEQFTQEVLSKC